MTPAPKDTELLYLIKIAAAYAGVEIVKTTNINANLGLTPSMAFAVQLNKMIEKEKFNAQGS